MMHIFDEADIDRTSVCSYRDFFFKLLHVVFVADSTH